MGKIGRKLKEGGVIESLFLVGDVECNEAFTDIAKEITKINSLKFAPKSSMGLPDIFKKIPITTLIIENIPLTEVVGANIKKLVIQRMPKNEDIGFICQHFPHIEGLDLWRPEGNLNIPDEIENLKELKSISLVRVELNSVSSKIKNLAKLTKLDFFEVNMTKFPIEFTTLENLEELHLKEVPISKFPAEIKNWSKLKLIVLDEMFKGKITHASKQSAEEFAADLIFDDTDINKTQSLPPEFSELKSLEQIRLRFCKLKDVNSLSGLPNLRNIELIETKISDLSGLSNLPEIKELTITKAANLSSLEGLNNLNSLQKIQLAWLENIHSLDSFKNMENLTHINLKGWELDKNKTKYKDALKPLSGLKCLEHLVIEGTTFDDRKKDMRDALQALIHNKNLIRVESDSISQDEWEDMKMP